MIAISAACAGRPTRNAREASYHVKPVVSVGVKSVVSTLAALRVAVMWTVKQVPRRQLAAIAATIVILVAVLLLVPRPGAMQLRDWATSVGPWFPLVFLAAHIVVTVFPFPRTAFTLASGLLFGPWLGIAIAVIASTFSALAAFQLVRAAGWRLDRLVPHPRVKSLDARLRQRGWTTVMSMRLIPAVPFSVLNYAAGASAVRVLPYTWATLAGLLPGTAAVVILGDALTNHVSPLLLLVSLFTASLGIAGLIYEIRTYPEHHPADAGGPTARCGDPASAADHPAAAATGAGTASAAADPPAR
jgi:uncharacterized membrane protein YdjX (TVP38/TMEM64 family)